VNVIAGYDVIKYRETEAVLGVGWEVKSFAGRRTALLQLWRVDILTQLDSR
jgi:hypothetical protein